MIIDLRKYGEELDAHVGAAEAFIARASYAQLHGIVSDLEKGRDTRREFTWSTKKAIRTLETAQYDRRDGGKRAVVGALSFSARFCPPIERKSHDWSVLDMSTHLKIYLPAQEADPIIHLHVDKKNVTKRKGHPDIEQLGPALHLQVSEQVTERLGMKLAIPRIPSGFLLPSDCLDFMLSELFSSDWPAQQLRAHAFGTMRTAQLARAKRFAEAVLAVWDASQKRTPISVLQDCSFKPALRLA